MPKFWHIHSSYPKMKTTSDKLHRLIKALSKSEKRYFKVNALKNADDKQINVFVQLFDLIEKQEEYDEEKIKAKLKNQPIVGYFAKAKNSLQNLVLDSLYNQYAPNNEQETEQKQLFLANLLYKKDFVDDALKMIEKVKKTADEHEWFELALSAIALEKHILGKEFIRKISFERLDDILEEEKHYYQKLLTAAQYWCLRRKVYALQYQKGKVLQPADLQFLADTLQDVLLVDFEKANSFKAQMDFYQIKSVCYFLLNKYQDALEQNRAFIKLFEQNPAQIALHPSRYKVAFSNYLFDCSMLKQYPEMLAGISTMRQWIDKPEFAEIPNVNADIFRITYTLELNMHRRLGNFTQATALLPNVIAGLELYETTLATHNLVNLYYLVAYIYFGAANYKKASEWTNRIIYEEERKVVEDVAAEAHLLNIIIAYEMQHFKRLDDLIDSTQRYFQYRKKLHKFEKTVINYLRKIVFAPNKREQKQLFEELDLALDELKSEGNLLRYFDFSAWITAKLENKPFEKVVQEWYQ